MNKPRIAITMGDPGGIGPEIILKALVRSDITEAMIPVVFGDEKILQDTADKLDLPFDLDSTDLQIEGDYSTCSGLFQPYSTCGPLIEGAISAENGKAAYCYIATATRAVLEKKVDGLCTAPISKESVKAAGYDFPGHTEMLAHFCGINDVRMMLVGGGLKVVLQTIHVALKDVPDLITTESIIKSLFMIRAFAMETGDSFPRIGICGLNPHAGEAGHFGREEIDIITPAVEKARLEGMNVTGPLPADTIFHRMLEKEFDYILAMYHDQALIPVKTLDFHGGVNVTVGLPLIRTSPDHGTAFNLAGKGVANESSMVAALLYAASLAVRQQGA